MVRTLLSYFRPHRKLFALDMFVAVTAAAIDVAFPVVSRRAMTVLLPAGTFGPFFAVTGIIIAAFILRSLCFFIMTYWGHTFGARVEADMRGDLFRHMQTLDYDFYDRNRTGNLMSRLTTDLFDITELSHHGPEDLLISLLTLIGAMVCMFTIEWRLALVVAVLIPIFLALTMSQRRRMSRASANVKIKMAGINEDIELSLSGMKTSHAFANEDVDNARFSRANGEHRTAKSEFYKAMAIFSSGQEFFMGIMPAVVIGAGGFLIMRGELDYVDLVTFTLFVTTFVTPIRKMAQFAEIFASGMAGLRRFKEIMDVEPTVREAPDAPELKVTDGRVEINNISFSYEGHSEVLHNIDLRVRGGETIAFVGESGGGKTTLCQLIPRFYDVTGGDILIDGQNVRGVSKISLRRAVGIVQQDVFIFADTIMENIRYGRPEASDEEVYEAARRAEIYDDILKMPEGFGTYVGERGTKLSGGQRQRVSIARIFLKDPAVLILDEATSALDTVTEAKIKRSFDELMKGRTSFVIAHRLSTVRNAERIAVIDGGSMKEIGTHDELMAKDGEYAGLYRAQEYMNIGDKK